MDTTREAEASTRKLRQDVFIRVCRDSGFKLEWENAARFAARVAECHPLDIWMAMPSMTVMQEIAAGTHPAARSRGETA